MDDLDADLDAFYRLRIRLLAGMLMLVALVLLGMSLKMATRAGVAVQPAPTPKVILACLEQNGVDHVTYDRCVLRAGQGRGCVDAECP